MKKLFILLSLVLIPSLLFAWTEPTGSTFTVTSGESWEIKDIQNDVHDTTHSAWTVYDISTGPYRVDEVARVIESSCVVKNFPSDYPDSTAQSSLGTIDTNTSNTYNQLKTSVTVSDKRYSNVNSSGTAGIITAATSGTITIAGKVTSYSFLYKSSVGTNMIRIKNAINGDGICLFNLDETDRNIDIPVALTFSLSNLLVGDTVQYDIGTLQP
jgi:hypothetical protein